ncbi:hypothetical protein C0J50_10312, partial [Silurus asotus]
FHLRNISKIRNMMLLQDAGKLVHAFVTSRLHYCNALLSGCANKCINKLQLVQNAAERVLTRSRKYDHITPVLISYLLVPQITKTTAGGRSFSYIAPHLWNSLPISVQDSDTVSVFKSRLKTYLFSQTF